MSDSFQGTLEWRTEPLREDERRKNEDLGGDLTFYWLGNLVTEQSEGGWMINAYWQGRDALYGPFPTLRAALPTLRELWEIRKANDGGREVLPARPGPGGLV